MTAAPREAAAPSTLSARHSGVRAVLEAAQLDPAHPARAPVLTCGHVTADVVVVGLCGRHPAGGLRCRACETEHIERHGGDTCAHCGGPDATVIADVAYRVDNIATTSPAGAGEALLVRWWRGGIVAILGHLHPGCVPTGENVDQVDVDDPGTWP